MAVPFSRTLRSLRSDRQPWKLAWLILLVVAATLVWIFSARVPVYEVSTSARIEGRNAPHSVSAMVEGRIVDSQLRVGLETLPGDVLVVLDAEGVRREMDQPQQAIATAQARLVELKQEIDARQLGITAQVKARELAAAESEANLEVSEKRARFAQQRLERIEALTSRSPTAVSKEELESVRSEAAVTEAQRRAVAATIGVGVQDRLVAEQREIAELAHLRQEAAQLEGDVSNNETVLRQLEYELELRIIRAYVSGRVEEVVPLRVGYVVKPTEKLATIVPQSEKRVVAQLPVVAVGRVAVGQTARLRLDGFPWTQYGTLSATVTGIGNEPSEGLIRVELSVLNDPSSRIPLQHGQTGTVEIEIEHVSPAALVLRAAGRFLTTNRGSSES